MSGVPRLEVEITFFAAEEGGRRSLPAPPWSPPGYMPHLTVGDGEYLGVRFVAGPAPSFGVPARFVLELMYHPRVCTRHCARARPSLYARAAGSSGTAGSYRPGRMPNEAMQRTRLRRAADLGR